jgi:acetate kinase
LHLPASISIMKIFLQSFPGIPQLACFDTFFHRHMPFEAKYSALPRSLWKKGIIRYGFHGLSCEYILQRLRRDDPSINEKRIIIAHLGSGCSLTAVKYGTSIDTTMGFSPAGGLMMSSRSGDIDPGIITWLLEQGEMNASELSHLFNQRSGIKAIAGSDHPMEELLKRKETDLHAAQAIRMFCYQVKKYIGAMAAAMGGLDILVYTGGIGENEPVIREYICAGLEFLGIMIDKKANEGSAQEINADNKTVSVRVIHTDEEFIIAKELFRFLPGKQKKGYATPPLKI